jgi:alkylation response protein AidB-like acyl-CoA dehydrogenase
MDFAFSEEQQMLREQARSVLDDKNSPERLVELATSEEGWDPALWKELASLGWTGLSLSEKQGGSGMNFVDEAVVIEELGYALYPGPYFSTVGLSLPAFRSDDELASRVAAGDASTTLAWAEEGSPFIGSVGRSVRAEGGGDSWRLSGDKVLVPDLNSASDILVVASADGSTGIWHVSTSDVQTQVLKTMDATRRFGLLSLSNTQARLLVEPGSADDVIEEIRLRALAALALEAVGVGQRVLDLAQDYTKERKQFDKPIGSYQAVSHQVADTYVETELARSLAYWAAWCIAEDPEQAKRAAPAAKSFAGEAAVAACERSIQVHGGIGFTWEHVLHRFYKRAQWIDSFDGFGARQRADVADLVIPETAPIAQ